KSVIAKPSGISVDTFESDTFKRLNNPNIPDDPMRIALNASTKILPRLMDTYWDAYDEGQKNISVILKPVAGILRYCLAYDDEGVEYKLEDDPSIELMKKCAEKAKSGISTKDAFKDMLSDAHLFGRNMFEYPKVLDTLCEFADRMLEKGGVAAIL
ncbi:MAG: hypothetical protein GX633_00790, partial [Clostridiales bacterium]|nr:hypothetical protein [Clostridiales bacterium]